MKVGPISKGIFGRTVCRKYYVFELAAFLRYDAASLRNWWPTFRNDVVLSSTTSTNHARTRHPSKKKREKNFAAKKAYKHKNIYNLYVCTCTWPVASCKQRIFLVYRFFCNFWSSSIEICLGFSMQLNCIQMFSFRTAQ